MNFGQRQVHDYGDMAPTEKTIIKNAKFLDIHVRLLHRLHVSLLRPLAFGVCEYNKPQLSPTVNILCTVASISERAVTVNYMKN